MRPIDADELIPALKDNPPLYNIDRVTDVINRWPTIDFWHKWPDEKPKKGSMCVVMHKANNRVFTEVALWMMELWWLDWDTNGIPLDVIRWMYLPDCYEEVDHA